MKRLDDKIVELTKKLKPPPLSEVEFNDFLSQITKKSCRRSWKSWKIWLLSSAGVAAVLLLILILLISLISAPENRHLDSTSSKIQSTAGLQEAQVIQVEKLDTETPFFARVVEPNLTINSTAKLQELDVAKTKNPAKAILIVGKNQTLGYIALRLTGDTSNWRRIALANPNINPNRLSVNQKLIIPNNFIPERPRPGISIVLLNDTLQISIREKTSLRY